MAWRLRCTLHAKCRLFRRPVLHPGRRPWPQWPEKSLEGDGGGENVMFGEVEGLSLRHSLPSSRTWTSSCRNPRYLMCKPHTSMVTLSDPWNFFSGIIENMWNPNAGAPPDSLVSNPGSEKAHPGLIGGGQSSPGREDFSDSGDGDDERMAHFEDELAPGGAPIPHQATASMKYSIPLNTATPPTKKPRTTGSGVDEAESMRGIHHQPFARM